MHRRPAASLPPLAALGLLGLLGLSGCGGGSAAADSAALAGTQAPPAWNGQITIASDPPGARCMVLRGGQTIAEVSSTPGNVLLQRSNDTLDLRCTAPGRLDTGVALRPERDFGVHQPQPTGPAAAFQIAEARRTGSTRRYTDATVHLPPTSFPTTEARDAWFASRSAAITAATAARVARAERSSAATWTEPADERRWGEEDLQRLQAQRDSVAISPDTAGRAPRGRR